MVRRGPNHTACHCNSLALDYSHTRLNNNNNNNNNNKLWGGRHNMPPPLQRKRAAAALSQAGRAGHDELVRAIPAGRPDVRDRRQTDRRQTRIIA